MAVVAPTPGAPQFEIPTPTGALQGVANFQWSGSAWVPFASGDGTNTTVTLSAGTATGQITPQVTATYTRAADATNYSVGDNIGNSVTAANVVPISFTVARANGTSGRIKGARCTVTAASGTIVLPAFDLLLFRAEANIPFAAGSYPADNGALNVSSAAMIQLLGVFSFSASAWRNQAGGTSAAGSAVWQAVPLAGSRVDATFNLASYNTQTILGLMQAQNTWSPGNVAQEFDFALDVSQD